MRILLQNVGKIIYDNHMSTNLENIEVNYKNKKRYKTARYPIRQPKFFSWLIYVLSKIFMAGEDYKIEKINMENLKPPYMMLSNHMHFADFKLAAIGTKYERVNNVVAIDGFYRRPWLMEWIGAIATRKFTMDLHLIKSINKVLKRGDILSMYPEARYTPCGIQSFIPDALGKIVKMNKVPVVAVVHRGNYLRTPFWNFRRKRKVPLRTTMTQILTAEAVQKMSVDEINAAIRKALEYNEYTYQLENNIKITEPFRAEGLHKILYQCPHCKEEEMDSKGTEIFCTKCGKRWNLNENGTLSALEGETEFEHIPDWFLWEKENVKKQVLDGTYKFEDEMEIYGYPRCYKFHKLGMAKVTHDIETGWTIKGHYRNQDYLINRKPLEMNSLHVEYDWIYVKPFDCFDVSTENDTFFCYPTKRNVLTKLAFATEEIYMRKLRQNRESK